MELRRLLHLGVVDIENGAIGSSSAKVNFYFTRDDIIETFRLMGFLITLDCPVG